MSDSDKNGLVIFQLSRPKSMNALSMDQVVLIDSHMRSLSNEPSCRGIIFTGEGDRAFCAGGDVLHIAESAAARSDWNRRWFSREFLLNYYISTYNKPVISVWKGVVMGGGVGLSIYGSTRIATETTVFAMPETSIGFFPDVGASFFLSHYVKSPGLGLYIGMTGYRMNGADALYAGLATHFVQTTQLNELFANLGISNDIVSTVETYNSSPTITLSLTPDKLRSIKEYFDFDKWEQFWDNLLNGASRKDPFAIQSLDAIRSRCPLTIRVWFESFRLGSNQSLDQVLEREYHMCIQATETDSYNFKEGVRALLIDKGKGAPPAYKPAALEEVTADMVTQIIEARDGGDMMTCLQENRQMY